MESAYSDSTRKIVRQIRVEWQKIIKYKNNIEAKEDELWVVKEKCMHLNEIKCYNEKYVETTKCRIKDLKQSNIQLKNKLSHLSKEDERITKKFKEQEVYMSKQLSCHEEKWRKRYETYYSKIPAFQEKERALTELKETKQKLYDLEIDIQKCKKDLFQAKCERNKRTIEESKFHPFQNFVVIIAKIYLEIKNEYNECKKISSKIIIMEKNIAAHRTKIQMQHFEEKRSLNTAKHVRFQVNENDERDIQMFHEAFDDTRSEFNVSVNPTKQCLSFTDQHKSTLLNEINFHKSVPVLQNEIKASKRKIHENEIDENAEKLKERILQSEQKNAVSTSVKVIQNEPKVLKWLEKLKIFTPKIFSPSTAETANIYNDEISRTTSFDTKDADIKNNIESLYVAPSESIYYAELKKNHAIPNKDALLSKYTKERDNVFTNNLHQRTSPLKKNLEVNSMHTNDITMQQTSSTKASKYFNVCNPGMQKHENAPVIKSCTLDSMEQNMSYEAMDIHEGTNNMSNSPVQKSMVIVSKTETDSAQCETIEFCNKKYRERPSITSFENKIKLCTPEESTDKMQQTNNIFNSETNRTEITENSFNEKKDTDYESHDETSIVGKKTTYSFTEKKMIDCYSIQKKNNHEEKSFENSPQNFNAEVEKKDFSLINEPVSEPVNTSYHIEIAEKDINDLKVTSLPPVQESENENKAFREKEIYDISIISKSETMKTELSNAAVQHSVQFQNVSPLAPLQQENAQTEECLKNSTSADSDITDIHLNASNKSQKEILPSSHILSTSDNLGHLSDNCSSKSIESDAETPKPIKSSAEFNPEMKVSPFASYKAESTQSPGFIYTTRPMYEKDALDANKESQDFPEEVKNLFVPFSFFNNPDNLKFPITESKSEDDNNEFLASAYENYLNDSPPVMKEGTEKSMFAFGEDSPETDAGQSDFFPLFAASNQETNKENNNTAQFVLNFGNASNAKSPDSSPSFKFLF